MKRPTGFYVPYFKSLNSICNCYKDEFNVCRIGISTIREEIILLHLKNYTQVCLKRDAHIAYPDKIIQENKKPEIFLMKGIALL